MSFFRGPKIVTNGLVLYLDAGNTKSYPTSGTTINDLSNLKNNGILNDGLSVSGNTLNFDGLDDNISTTWLNVGNVFTFECLVKFNNISGYVGGVWKRESLIANSYPYLANKGFFVCATNQDINPPYQSSIPGYERLFISLGNDQKTTVTSAGVFENNKWYNIACVVNGSSLTKIYINGVETSYIQQLDGNISLTYDSTCYIGKRVTGEDVLDGKLSFVKLYNRALSTSEVLQNYNATKSRFGL